MSRSPVPRFAHGSRVPGWDEAVDLTKPPAVVPDPATDARARALRAEIEAAMAKYPDRRSAAIPALHAAQERARLVLARGDRAGRRGDAADPGLPDLGGDASTTCSRLTPEAAHTTSTCARTSPARCAARDEFYEAMLAAAAERADVNVRSFECLGACDIAPDGLGRRRVRRAAGRRGRRPDRRGPRSAGLGPRRCEHQAAALPAACAGSRGDVDARTGADRATRRRRR